MKNVVWAVALFLFSIVLTSCSNEDDEPRPNEPVKTDLEIVQEVVDGSTWTLQTADVTVDGVVYTYNGDCDFTVFPGSVTTGTQTNVTDFEYTFAKGKLSYQEQCGTQSATDVTYTITKSDSDIILSYLHGSSTVKFLLQTPVDQLEGSATVKVKRIAPLVGNATEAVLTFSKQN